MSWRCTSCNQENTNDELTSCFYCGATRQLAPGKAQNVPQAESQWYIKCTYCGTKYPCEGENDSKAECEICRNNGKIWEAGQLRNEVPLQDFPEPEPQPVVHYRLRFVALGQPRGRGCNFTVSEEGAALGREEPGVAQDFFKTYRTVSKHHLRVFHDEDGWYIENQQHAQTKVNEMSLEPMERRCLYGFPIRLQLGNIPFHVSEEMCED